MSQENVETVHRLYAASRWRDKEAIVRESDPNVEIVIWVMGIEGTVYRGHAGVRRYIDDLFSAFPDWHPEILRTTDCGDKVLAEVRLAGRGSSSGVAIEQTVWQVTTFHDGKMVGSTDTAAKPTPSKPPDEAVSGAGIAVEDDPPSIGSPVRGRQGVERSGADELAAVAAIAARQPDRAEADRARLRGVTSTRSNCRWRTSDRRSS